MARRYRYAFAKKKEAQKGKLSTGLAAASLILFITAVLLAFFMNGEFGYIVGGVSLCAMLLSIYGFAMGLKNPQDQYDRINCKRDHYDRMAGNFPSGNFQLKTGILFTEDLYREFLQRIKRNKT